MHCDLTTRILHHSQLQSVTGVWTWVKNKKIKKEEEAFIWRQTMDPQKKKRVHNNLSPRKKSLTKHMHPFPGIAHQSECAKCSKTFLWKLKMLSARGKRHDFFHTTLHGQLTPCSPSHHWAHGALDLDNTCAILTVTAFSSVTCALSKTSPND